MAFAIRLTCDELGCESCAAVAITGVGESERDASVMTSEFQPGLLAFRVESEWIDVPEGWQVTREGRVYCAEHARG
jgi:hypothetical protein